MSYGLSPCRPMEAVPIKARRLAPTYEHDTEGIIIGTSNAPKMGDRPVAIPIEAGDMHTRILGPSGVGKSNLLLNLCSA
jgi:hypothetical protein